ncbi:MAG: M13 family metallopeptidase [Bacilli bacterium]|nr:M13 family metallopeptidase [Bacilli bacterium]
MPKVRIQDDLFNYVNGEWIENATIPDDKPTAGGFADLGVEVEENLMRDFREMCEKNEYPNDYLKRACDVYKALMNTKKRNKEGIKPALKYLSKFSKINNISQFNRNLKDLVLSNFTLPFRVYCEIDMKNTSRYCIFVQGPDTILPDTTYYKEERAQQKAAILGLWANMAQAILAKTKLSPEEQQQYLADTLKFDEIISTLVKSSEERSEYTKAYNPTKVRKVCSLLKPVKFKKLLQDLIGEVPETIIVAEPRFLQGFSKLFNEENFTLYKHWAYVRELLDLTKFLSEELREIGGSYRRALQGIAKMANVEKFSYQMASALFSEPVGLYYGEKYFGEEAKKDVIEMVHQIIDKYKERVANSPVLSQPTRDKAILKLNTMVIKMGYPDKVEEIYDKLVFNPEDSAMNIALALTTIRIEDSYLHYKETPRRDKWAMPGHMVNACYNPMTNDITFPAAILQAPFYSIKQTRSQNLGGIGAVIGHEISHAFDNNGTNFDENGNLNNWWTKEDHKRFKKSTNDMIKQFDGIELPWGRVNGALIVSENIADNGGMAVTLNIMKDTPNANYEEYFINWAKVWCMKAKPEYQALLLNVDVHAPAILRANMQPRNFPEWYETFKVTKKDQMYIAPNKRIVVW